MIVIVSLSSYLLIEYITATEAAASRDRQFVEGMKAIYYLLSSSQGFPISKCNTPSSNPEPNWQNIARVIAFVSNIFPKQEEIQFSDGQYTFFSKPQLQKNGAYYFVTIFTADGPLLNLSSLSSYIGFVTGVLFQIELEECLKHLGDQITSAIQSSTYHDTIQNCSAGNGDDDHENALFSLHEIFPVLLERLSVFEEHFIRELLICEREFYYRWFLPVSDYLHKADLSTQNCFSELYVVYQLSKDDILSPLLTVHRNQNCHNETFVDDLRLSLIEYARSPALNGGNLAGVNPIASADQQQVSHVLNVVSSHPSTTTLINEDGDVTLGSYFAVSKFSYVSNSHNDITIDGK